MTPVQPSTHARYRPVEDPELLKMMATHVHCGEVMQLLAPDPHQPGYGTADGGVLTYHCACGFNFDEEAPELPA